MKPNVKDKFVCKYCDETFTVELALFKHYEQCSKKPARFTCHKCGRDFRHEINLQKHNSRCVGEFFKKPRIVPASKSYKKEDLSDGASGSQVCPLPELKSLSAHSFNRLMLEKLLIWLLINWELFNFWHLV